MTTRGPGAGTGGDAPPLRLPDPGLLFDARAARFRALAAGHAAPGWLLLLGRIAAGQALAVREVAAPRARAPVGGPPLAHDLLPRDGAWRRMLAVLLSTIPAASVPPEAADAVRDLARAGPDELEPLADAILAGAVPHRRVASAPFVGAALQAWLSGLAAGLDPAALAPAQGSCPVCGGPPVAGVVQASDRLRYVTCALCSSEWYVPRLQCAICAREQLEYLHAEGDRGAQVEACRSCTGYLKLFEEEHRPGVEPAADDAATIALDLLVADEGYRRAGPNVYVAAGVLDAG